MTFPNRTNYRREKSEQAELTASDVPVASATFAAFHHVSHKDVLAVALQSCDQEEGEEEEDVEERTIYNHPLLPLAQQLLTLISQPAKLLAALVVDCSERSSRNEFWLKAAAFQRAELRDLSSLCLEQLDESNLSSSDVTMLKLVLHLWRVWQFVSLVCVDAVTCVDETATQQWTSVLQKRRASSLDDQCADALSQGMILSGSGLAKRSRITKKSNEFLVAWFLAHKDNPYPSPDERADIADKTGLAEQQVRNWFANMRKRHWKPNRANAKKPRCLLDYVLRQAQA